MKAWKIILIPTLITLAIGGIYLFSVWKHRQNPGVIAKKDSSETTLSKDDLVVMRAFFPQHFDDLQRLEGTTVWMKDGYAISYFPYAGGHVDFAITALVAVIPLVNSGKLQGLGYTGDKRTVALPQVQIGRAHV